MAGLVRRGLIVSWTDATALIPCNHVVFGVAVLKAIDVDQLDPSAAHRRRGCSSRSRLTALYSPAR
jgi:hypothetical protein